MRTIRARTEYGVAVVQFETFTKSLAARARDPHITVQKRGTITMNAAAFALLGAPEAVELLFDHDDNQLGIRAVETAVEHAVFVRPATRSPNGPYVLSAMAFVRHYGIDTGEARRYPVVLDDGLLCAHLDGPSDVVSKRPAHGKDQLRRPRPR